MASMYSVILSKPDQFQIPAIAKALVAFKKILFQDAVLTAKKCWGFVGESLEQETALLLQSKMTEAGIEGIVIPSETIAVLPTATQIKKFDFSNEETVPWSKLGVMAALGFNQSTTTTKKVETGGRTPTQQMMGLGIMLATGLPISFGEKKKIVEKKVQSNEFIYLLDLILRSPVRRFRIDPQNFDFSCLPEKGMGVFVNFKKLLVEVAGKSPQSLRSKGAQILLDNQPVNLMGYEGLHDFERECRWLMTLDQLKNKPI